MSFAKTNENENEKDFNNEKGQLNSVLQTFLSDPEI